MVEKQNLFMHIIEPKEIFTDEAEKEENNKVEEKAEGTEKIV